MTGQNRNSATAGEISKKLGEYLGCDPEQISLVLDQQLLLNRQGQYRKLGDLIVEMGLVCREALQGALLEQRYDRLKTCKLFSEVSLREILDIRNLVSEVTVEEGTEFIRQDEQGDDFFILVRGRAEVFRRGGYGEDVHLADVDIGESIGEMGYFSDGRRSASVRAVHRTELLRITYKDLDRIFDISPSITRNFLNLVAERLRQTNVAFQDVVQKQRKTETSLEYLNRFMDMSEISSINADISGLIERIVSTARQIMDADRASLFLLDPYTGELWSKVAEGLKNREIRIPKGKGVAGWVAEHGEIVNIQDAYFDSRFDQTFDKKTGYRTKSILCGPVKDLRGQTVGVIQVINKLRGSTFDPSDEAMFKAFAYQTAIAVENFHLYCKMTANHRRMAIFLDVATSLSQTMDLDALISKIVSKISEILDADRASLFLLDSEKKELWSKVAQGTEMAEIRFPMTLGLAGHAACTGTIVNISDAYLDSRFNQSVDRETGYRTRSILCVPVLNRDGKIIGVTQAINKHSGCFEQDDEEMIQALSSEIAVALENAQLYERTLHMKNYLAGVQDSITSGIITLDDHWRIITANKAAEALFSSVRDGLLQRDLREVLDPVNKAFLERVERIYSGQSSVVDFDVSLFLSAAKQQSVNINFFPMLGKDDVRQGVVLVIEDITREKRIKGTLTRYMAKDIVERLLDDPTRQGLGGIQSKATVLFSDIRGYTGIAEGMSAAQTVAFLNEYFTAMVDVIFTNGGVLDKFIGDAMMAVFGVPFSQEDDAIRAVKAGMAMRSVLAGMNEVRSQHGQQPIRIGIGICTGEVISGNIGSELRMDYTVIGDGVNIASRLEGLNKFYNTGILISDTTYSELGGAFAARLIDEVIVKGKSTPVSIYEVLGPAGQVMSPSQQDFVQGLDLYRQGAFAEAAGFFSRGKAEDPVCSVFLARCEHFMQEPPGNQWNRVWISKEK